MLHLVIMIQIIKRLLAKKQNLFLYKLTKTNKVN